MEGRSETDRKQRGRKRERTRGEKTEEGEEILTRTSIEASSRTSAGIPLGSHDNAHPAPPRLRVLPTPDVSVASRASPRTLPNKRGTRQQQTRSHTMPAFDAGCAVSAPANARTRGKRIAMGHDTVCRRRTSETTANRAHENDNPDAMCAVKDLLSRLASSTRIRALRSARECNREREGNRAQK